LTIDGIFGGGNLISYPDGWKTPTTIVPWLRFEHSDPRIRPRVRKSRALTYKALDIKVGWLTTYYEYMRRICGRHLYQACKMCLFFLPNKYQIETWILRSRVFINEWFRKGEKGLFIIDVGYLWDTYQMSQPLGWSGVCKGTMIIQVLYRFRLWPGCLQHSVSTALSADLSS